MGGERIHSVTLNTPDKILSKTSIWVRKRFIYYGDNLVNG